jgi:two-component system OmpR family response regulator
MRLLLVEDETDLARTLRRALEEDGFAVDVCANGEDALHLAVEVPYDAIVLDLMIPEVDGWEVLRRLREAGRRTGVLILTARDTVDDKVRGLDLGGDDYLTKPFDLGELAARLRALIRRTSGNPSPLVAIGDLTVDMAARRVFRRGAAIDLTAREFAILELLVRWRGALVSRSTICEHIYDEDDDVASNVVDVHVASLRRKLGHDVIRTRRGQGYIMEAPDGRIEPS